MSGCSPLHIEVSGAKWIAHVFIQLSQMIATRKPLEDSASASPVRDSVSRSPDRKSATKPADAWLAGLLSGGAVKVIDIQAAANCAGISMRTVERAKKRLGVKAAKLDMRAGWVWSLPDEDRHKATEQSEQATIPAPGLAASPPGGPALWQVVMVRNDYASAEATPRQLVPLWAVMGRR